MQVTFLWAASSIRSAHRCPICIKKTGSTGTSVCSVVKTADTRMQVLTIAANVSAVLISWTTRKSNQKPVKRSESQSAGTSRADVRSKSSEQVSVIEKISFVNCVLTFLQSYFPIYRRPYVTTGDRKIRTYMYFER